MGLIRPLLISLCVGLATLSMAGPTVLIVQDKVPVSREVDLNVPIADFVADLLDRDGRVEPIVANITDPIFRQAVIDQQVKELAGALNLAQAQETATKLKAEYLLVVKSFREKNEVHSRALLYRGEKLIWKDPTAETMVPGSDTGDEPPPSSTTTIGKVGKNPPKRTQNTPPPGRKIDYAILAIMGPDGLDMTDTGRSQARTWMELLNAGPFKGHVAHPKNMTPAIGEGQAPIVANLTAGPRIVDNKALQANLASLNKAGLTAQAINALRDAIDAEPMDIDRRLWLIKALLTSNQSELAAREARRAAELMPDRIELRTMAARAWLQVGNDDEAQTDLNEAIARAPDSPETRILLAEVALAQGKPKSAIEHLDKALADKVDPDALYKRALARTLIGDAAGANDDLQKAAASGLSQDPADATSRYVYALEMADAGTKSSGDELKSLIERALVQRKDAEVQSVLDEQKAQALARLSLLSRLTPPAKHKGSHDRHLLAYKLLAQSLSDLEAFIKSGDEDVLSDARINLGEALKQAVAAKDLLRAEAQGTVKNARAG